MSVTDTSLTAEQQQRAEALLAARKALESTPPGGGPFTTRGLYPPAVKDLLLTATWVVNGLP